MGKTSAVEVVTSVSPVGFHVPSENTSIGHRQGKDHLDQSSLEPPTIEGNWLEQVWLAGDVNSKSSEE